MSCFLSLCEGVFAGFFAGVVFGDVVGFAVFTGVSVVAGVGCVFAAGFVSDGEGFGVGV